MKEEDNILNRCGREDGFDAPEGFYETFTQKIMETLVENPVKQPKPESATLRVRMRPYLYLAAMLAGAALLLQVLRTSPLATKQTVSAKETALSQEEMAESQLSESLAEINLDDYSLYLYLADYEP